MLLVREPTIKVHFVSPSYKIYSHGVNKYHVQTRAASNNLSSLKQSV